MRKFIKILFAIGLLLELYGLHITIKDGVWIPVLIIISIYLTLVGFIYYDLYLINKDINAKIKKQ